MKQAEIPEASSTFTGFAPRTLLQRVLHPRRVHIESGYESLRPFVASLPELFSRRDDESVIYHGRNELRSYGTPAGEVVVKSYAVPHLLNRFVYGFFRSSKAARSCRYATLLRSIGVGSPAPVGWCEERMGPLFTCSYYVCRRSELPWSYVSVIKGEIYEARLMPLMEELGRVAGRMNRRGIFHKDFSRGNILLGFNAEGDPEIEIIDLNRIRFHEVSMEQGCGNFHQLPATPAMHRAIARGYARERGFDEDSCYHMLRSARRAKGDFGLDLEEAD